MIRTRFTELCGIEHPIVGGAMMYITSPELVAAISNAGALGLLPSQMYGSKEEFRAAVRRVRDLTQKPFGVNITLLPALKRLDAALYVDVILEEGVRIVETSAQRPPDDVLGRLREAGVTLIHKCVSVRHALSAQRAGAQAVTLVGTEGGGAIGELGFTTMVLVPSAVDALDVPVLAAGGIVDGRGLAAALALGAQGVTLGTRLLLTTECPIHDNVKQALAAAGESDTVLVLTSLHSGYRAWKNAAAQKVVELEREHASPEAILQLASGRLTRRMLEEGDVDAGLLSCSQALGRIREIRSVAEVVEGMVREAEGIRGSPSA